MKKLIIAALAVAAATTMYAQGTVKMTSTNPVSYGKTCGALEGELIGADFTGSLMYEGNVIATEPFNVSSKGKNTGKLKGGLVDTTLPAGTTVSGLTVQATASGYFGESAPFSYTTGDPSDPTKLPDASLMFDSFSVEYIPEPTTIALGILGLSSLLVFRRRD